VPDRRLLLVALLGLVLAIGGALGRPDIGAATAPASAVSHSEAGHREATGPCVTRPDCAGALAFGTAALLLAVVVTSPTVGAVTTGTRLTSRPQLPLSRLEASRLFRPPQFS
jgi:hypothetical protein